MSVDQPYLNSEPNVTIEIYKYINRSGINCSIPTGFGVRLYKSMQIPSTIYQQLKRPNYNFQIIRI